ncbi:TlpA family protein disulfide reductase [Sphaerisporangium sp. NPDC049003]|uniref:TlpA family protein disulfide reductase n=1 Tax=Sphaerisporangium sp. NPDC049003 TaxID=3364517 RepID=UPI0037122EDA
MLITAVIVVGVLVLLDLVLTFGVIRRLREHTEQLGQAHHGPTDLICGKGTEIAGFAAVTTEGEQVSRGLLSGETLVGFLSPTCQPCEKLLPSFVEYAAAMPGGRDQVLVVIADDGPGKEKVPEKVAMVSPYARVVTEGYEGPLHKAFAVSGYPGVCLVRDGIVEVSGSSLDAFPDHVRR